MGAVYQTAHEKARPQGNDETYGRAKLRRDITNAKQAGSGRHRASQKAHRRPVEVHVEKIASNARTCRKRSGENAPLPC